MATLTTRISDIDFPFSGNTTQTTTISWALPSVPVGSTITACSLTGTVLVDMNKGSLGSVTVGGVAVTPGNSFAVDLEANNTIDSVIVAVKGGNKNASGTISLGGLTYKVTYIEPAVTYTVTFKDWDGTVLKTEEVSSGSSATAPEVSRYGYILTGWSVDFTNVRSNITTVAQYEIVNVLTIKENGSWSNIGRVFKKTSGVWVEQANLNWNELFNTNLYYVKQEIPIPTAILYSDGTMVFQDNGIVDYGYGEAVSTYTGWDINNYDYAAAVPWYTSRKNINNIILNTTILPKYTACWFYGCSNLISLDLSGFDMSDVRGMSGMFAYCSSLTSINLSNLNTSNVTDMTSVFYNCSSLTSLDLNSFNTSNVSAMSGMFHGCSNLISLDLSGFDMSNIAASPSSTASMFKDCTNLTTIYVKDETAKTKIEASSDFPTTATVIIGKPN